MEAELEEMLVGAWFQGDRAKLLLRVRAMNQLEITLCVVFTNQHTTLAKTTNGVSHVTRSLCLLVILPVFSSVCRLLN